MSKDKPDEKPFVVTAADFDLAFLCWARREDKRVKWEAIEQQERAFAALTGRHAGEKA